MTNGKMIDELSEILNDKNQINSRTANRLTLAAMKEILQNQQESRQIYESLFEEAKREREKLQNNLAVQAGFFIEQHPKRFLLFVVLFLTFINAFYISGFRQPILKGIFTILGVPPELIEIIP